MPQRLRRIAARALGIFRRRALLEDLELELAEHLRLLAEEFERRGVAPAEAQRQARLRLGMPAAIREEQYEGAGWPLVEALLQDVRYGLRVLRKSPAFTLAVVLTLAIGIGGNVAVFTLADALLLRALPYRDVDRLALIDRQPIFDFVQSRAHYQEWKRASSLLEDAALYGAAQGNLTGGAEPVHVRVAVVSANLPHLFGAVPLLGRNLRPEEDEPGASDSIMIGARLWLSQFGGDRSVVGRAVRLSGRRYFIVGVLPAGFDFPEGAEVLVPSIHTPERLPELGVTFQYGVVRLKPGVTAARAAAQQASLFAARKPDPEEADISFAGMEKIRGPHLKPLRRELADAGYRPVLRLAGAGALVLLIACVNVANLVLARMVAREREFAVRLALGVSSGRLFRQVVTEQVLLSIAGGVAGIVAAYAALPALETLLPGDWPGYARPAINARVLWFALAVSFLAGLGTALGPALRLVRRSRGSGWFQAAGSRGGEAPVRSGARYVLVSVEAALATVLVACAGLLARSLVNLEGVNPGFRPQQVLAVSLVRPEARQPGNSEARSFYADVLERLRAIPGVDAVSGVDYLPARALTVTMAEARPEFAPAARAVSVTPRAVAPGYFSALGIPLVAGRDFDAHDTPAGERVAVISQGLARKLGDGTNVLGRRLVLGQDPPLTVVGVAGSVLSWGPRSEPLKEVYRPYAQSVPDSFTFVMRTRGEPVRYAAAARRAVRERAALQPIDEIAPMDDYVSRSLSGTRSMMRLAALFSAFGMALAVVGVHGLVSYMAARRTHEFGIRLALGAEPRGLLAASTRDAMRWVAPGVGAGVLLAVAAGRLIESELFLVQPWDPAVLAGVAAALLAAAALAAYIAARRAAVLDPVQALRQG
jgi:putative ABC transport system permease protein